MMIDKIKKWGTIACTLITEVISSSNTGQSILNNYIIRLRKTETPLEVEEASEVSIDLEQLEATQSEYLGQFTLEQNDVVIYDIMASGQGSMMIGFTKEHDDDHIELLLGHEGKRMIELKQVNELEPGTYHLWVSGAEGELTDITGNILIQKDQHKEV